MAEKLSLQQSNQQDATSATTTVTLSGTDSHNQDIPILHLKLRKPKPTNDRKVQWTTETVDNEDMDKKKSKCCCIYKKPKEFGESSSSSSSEDEDCDSCQGHVDKKKKKHTKQGEIVRETEESGVSSTTTEGVISIAESGTFEIGSDTVDTTEQNEQTPKENQTPP